MFKIIESLQAIEKAVNYFRKKLHHRCLTRSEIHLSLFVFRFFCLGSCQISMMEYFLRQFPVSIYLLKVNNERASANLTKWSNTLQQFVGSSRRIVWVCLTILWGWHWRLSGVYIIAFEHISHLVLLFLLLTLNM